VGKKSVTADRKAKLEEMRRQQAAAERRRTMLVGGIAGLLVLALVAAVGLVIRNQIVNSDITKVGVASSAAGCDPATTDKVSGASEHVGPGTNSPNVTKVDYATAPPSSGKHFAVPESPSRAFYTASDRPQLETLVHNLEHGYTILWYDQKLPTAQQNQLRKLAPLMRKSDAAGPKFIVSAWDDSRGTFPAGKLIALSHWGKDQGHRMYCGQVSGAAVKSFVKKYPYSDSPEPNAA
jgi:Protein of unknown function (DUF3105)